MKVVRAGQARSVQSTGRAGVGTGPPRRLGGSSGHRTGDPQDHPDDTVGPRLVGPGKRTAKTSDGTVLATLTASGWHDEFGIVVAAADAEPVSYRRHRCSGSSTSSLLTVWSDSPDATVCSACGTTVAARCRS